MEQEIKLKCPCCGGEFRPSKIQLYRKKIGFIANIYCSRSCSNRVNWKKYLKLKQDEY